MAINVQTIQGEWNYLCGLARQRWSQLTEDDLGALEGNHRAARRPDPAEDRRGA